MPYDTAILGAGPGGYVCAIRSAQRGLKTLLIEERDLGGTCLNRGCIPTKTILQSAHLFRNMRNLAKFGVHAEAVSFDYEAVAARRDKIVGQLQGGIANLLKSYGVTVVNGRGRLTSSRTVAVGGETYETDNIVIATGTRSSLPDIDGIDGSRILSTDDFLALNELPESAVIIGGGITGIEFASILASFGKKVTVLKRSPEILPGADEEIVRLLLRKLKQLRIDFKAGITFKRITGDTEKTVEYIDNTSQKEMTAAGSVCILCTGRKPNTDGLGLETANIETNRGYISVNGELATNVPHVYAIGDVNGKRALAHAASQQAKKVADMLGHAEHHYCDEAVPSCLYTDPEAAWVGLSEKEARQKYGDDINIGRYHVPGNGRALAMGVDTGLVKIIAGADGNILGAHLICPHAAEMIAEFSYLIAHKRKAADLTDVIHPHPTLSETIGEAADDVFGICCHTPKRSV